MSLPIDIPRRASRSSPSSSASSSLATSSPATTPSTSPGLYIPIHKRTASSETSHGLNLPAARSGIYSVDFLLSLRPTADESVRDKLLASHPQLVLSRRIRKNIEFHQRQRPHLELQVLPPREAQHIDVGIHRLPSLPSQKQLHIPSAQTLPLHGRVVPRRNSRTTIRPVDRRRQASKIASTETWRGAPLAV